MVNFYFLVIIGAEAGAGQWAVGSRGCLDLGLWSLKFEK